jgi:RNA polymerase sigma factor (TIGR02999 family)
MIRNMGERATSTIADTAAADQRKGDKAFLEVYQELRRIARAKLREQPPEHTLQTTALVHEAFLKLHGANSLCDRKHFLRLAADAMRQILIDHARAKGRLKRGGKQMRREEITDVASLTASPDSDAILALEAALCRLEIADPCAAEVIKLRFFTGLSIQETAEVTGLSGTTVNRKWKFARAWLYKEMGSDSHGRSRTNARSFGQPSEPGPTDQGPAAGH